LGGGTREGSRGREVAWKAFTLTLKGELPGLTPKLARELREDSLSPGLKEVLAATAREVARGEYLVSKDEEKALRAAAERVNTKFMELIERDGKWVERFKPLVVPTVDQRYLVKPLIPEWVGTWIERKGRYIYVTYWFRFPYDLTIWEKEPEFEPFTVVIDRYSGKAVEYQFRVHWKIIRVKAEYIKHVGGRPKIGFSFTGHTPIPALTIKGQLEIMTKYPGLGAAWLEINRIITLLRPHNITPEIHIGPSRKEVSKWKRNPLSSPWYEELEE